MKHQQSLISNPAIYQFMNTYRFHQVELQRIYYQAKFKKLPQDLILKCILEYGKVSQKLIIQYVFISNNVESILILTLMKMLSVQQIQNNKLLTFCSFIGLLCVIVNMSFLIVLLSKPNYQPQIPLLMFLTSISAFLFLFCMFRLKYEQNKKNQQLLQGQVFDQIIIQKSQPQQWPSENTTYYQNLNTQQYSNLNHNQPQQNVYPNVYQQPSNFNYPAQDQTNNINTNQQFYQQQPNVAQWNTNLNNQQRFNQPY